MPFSIAIVLITDIAVTGGRNWNKLQPDELLGPYADFTITLYSATYYVQFTLKMA